MFLRVDNDTDHMDCYSPQIERNRRSLSASASASAAVGLPRPLGFLQSWLAHPTFSSSAMPCQTRFILGGYQTKYKTSSARISLTSLQEVSFAVSCKPEGACLAHHGPCKSSTSHYITMHTYHQAMTIVREYFTVPCRCDPSNSSIRHHSAGFFIWC